MSDVVKVAVDPRGAAAEYYSHMLGATTSLPTCGFVAQLVERPTSIWEARVQAPLKPEFFSGFFFCNFFNCSLPARINLLLIQCYDNSTIFTSPSVNNK